jgi:hypothetical protein
MPTKPGSGWEMKDFRWRARSRRQRTQSILALPSWMGTALLVVLVLISCGLAASYVLPQTAQLLQRDMATAQTSLPPTETAAPPQPTRTPGATSPASSTTRPPTAVPTAVAAPTEPPAATPTVEPTQGPAIIRIGATVQIGGTNGIGLSLRAGASVAEPLVRVASDGEQLVIVEGPVDHDGYTWWKVHNDLGADGWGADAFMSLVTP